MPDALPSFAMSSVSVSESTRASLTGCPVARLTNRPYSIAAATLLSSLNLVRRFSQITTRAFVGLARKSTRKRMAMGVQHGFYAEAFRVHLPCLATRASLGKTTRRSDTTGFFFPRRRVSIPLAFSFSPRPSASLGRGVGGEGPIRTVRCPLQTDLYSFQFSVRYLLTNSPPRL